MNPQGSIIFDRDIYFLVVWRGGVIGRMDSFSVYRDIQARTKGQFLVGVVGPVRTGKSTFIRRFMELFALQGMDERTEAEVRDQLP